MSVDEERVRRLNSRPIGSGPVVYWMSRDQRVLDNWALLFADAIADRENEHLVVAFCLVPSFLGASLRQYRFMLDGLRGVELSLAERGIGLEVLAGEPAEILPAYLEKTGAGALVCDFDPLRAKRVWRRDVAKALEVACFEVDAHNVVPCWRASGKREYAAYTIRPRIHGLLQRFLTEYPAPGSRKDSSRDLADQVDWEALERSLEVDPDVGPVDWIAPGEEAALDALEAFCADGLARYGERNDPNSGAESGLSPHLHFGQLSAQRVALEVTRADVPEDVKEGFLEELIVRRELSDNFCLQSRRYDTTAAFPDWAKKTLGEHSGDRRQYLYTRRQFEGARTHDDLWNAAQLQMVERGKMHGYMRMYWAKKILEWSRTPSSALSTAIYLNDRYELDGRDPNGYAGVAWAIGGVHDRAFKERAVFGKIRYMSYEGCRRKFDVDRYVASIREPDS